MKDSAKNEFLKDLFAKLRRRKFIFYLDSYIDYMSGKITDDDVATKEREKAAGSENFN